VSRVECLVLTSVSANIAVAIFFKVENGALKIATAMFAETLVNTKHLTRLLPESRSYTFLFIAAHTACLACLLPFDLTTLTVFHEEHTLCNILRPSVSFSLLGPNILLNVLF
jgi:hypothetical protein